MTDEKLYTGLSEYKSNNSVNKNNVVEHTRVYHGLPQHVYLSFQLY